MSTTWQWSSVVRAFETNSMVLIYTSEVTILRLPKRFFASPEQRVAWESMMEAKLGPTWRKSPGWLARFL